VVLLFQPAEETGEGAAKVISDDTFSRIKPDFAFAIHNLPGFPLNSVVIRNGLFSAASKGMIAELRGKTSHASEPEKGLSPAIPMAQIVMSVLKLPQMEGYRDFVLSTVVFAKLGEVALGTSPGYARVISTLRAYRGKDMALLADRAVETSERIAEKSGVELGIDWIQEFPPTSNDRHCVELVSETASELGLKTVSPEEPFRWSEDFGHFTALCPGAIFGIGSGTDHSALHNPDYDFPEEIIPTGIEMFEGIIKRILKG
jgi:metal-dependent amidase/aminoacylase/carboxypeptidase family protein